MPSIAERIYSLSPMWLQSVILTVYGMKLRRQRHGAAYRRALRHFVEKDYSDLAAEQANQLQELKRLLRHAAEKSPFHAARLAGIDIEAFADVDALRAVPVLDKETLRQNASQVYTIDPADGIEAFTGGTTGKSLRVFYTKDDMQTRMAYLDAFKLRCGVDPGARKATFSGRAIATGLFQRGRRVFWRDNWAYRQRLYSTFDLVEGNLPAYVENLNAFKPVIVNGFVSAIHQVARHLLATGTRLDFVPAAIFTTSETLLDHHREAIERAFGAKVYDQYASAEGAPFITECRKGRLHYNIDTGVIETIDTPSGPSSMVTSFTTYGTPLIRYEVGDVVRFAEGTCDCGSSHPLVSRIEGRKVDYLWSPERGRVSLSHLADVIKGLPNCVEEMQFVQDEPDRVVIRVVVDDTRFDASAEAKIRSSMEYRFGKRMRVGIQRVDAIPREPSGKFRLIVNEHLRARMAGGEHPVDEG